MADDGQEPSSHDNADILPQSTLFSFESYVVFGHPFNPCSDTLSSHICFYLIYTPASFSYTDIATEPSIALVDLLVVW